MNCEKCYVESKGAFCSECGTSLTAPEIKTNEEKWGPCPTCNSENIEQRGKKYWFQIGLLSTGIFIVAGFILPILWICSLAGFFFMIASPLLPKIFYCKDCKKAWK
ncbi:MAG TPA: hypothetical protein VN426_08885 [Syntrophomonadaceae bacterium]|nr:hypothetical protein [Syntrophomonadaceae bacterium]